MMDASSTAIVDVSGRIYRVCLLVYPKPFRRVYGPHMVQVFRDCCRAAYRRAGVAGVLLLWLPTLLDLTTSALQERLTEVFEMSGNSITRRSGLALILGGVLWMIAIAGTLREELPYPLRYQVREIADAIGVLAVPALILCVVGIAGLWQRYAQRAGRLGRSGMALALVGAGGGSISFAATWAGLSDLWVVGMLSLVCVGTGLALFGLACLRSNAMSRGNFVPLAGVVLPVFVGLHLGYSAVNGGASLQLDPWLNFTVLAIPGISLGLLGYILHSDQRNIRRVPAAA